MVVDNLQPKDAQKDAQPKEAAWIHWSSLVHVDKSRKTVLTDVDPRPIPGSTTQTLAPWILANFNCSSHVLTGLVATRCIHGGGKGFDWWFQTGVDYGWSLFKPFVQSTWPHLEGNLGTQLPWRKHDTSTAKIQQFMEVDNLLELAVASSMIKLHFPETAILIKLKMFEINCLFNPEDGWIVKERHVRNGLINHQRPKVPATVVVGEVQLVLILPQCNENSWAPPNLPNLSSFPRTVSFRV